MFQMQCNNQMKRGWSRGEWNLLPKVLKKIQVCHTICWSLEGGFYGCNSNSMLIKTFHCPVVFQMLLNHLSHSPSCRPSNEVQIQTILHSRIKLPSKWQYTSFNFNTGKAAKQNVLDRVCNRFNSVLLAQGNLNVQGQDTKSVITAAYFPKPVGC